MLLTQTCRLLSNQDSLVENNNGVFNSYNNIKWVVTSKNYSENKIKRRNNNNNNNNNSRFAAQERYKTVT
jgi:hypothetical protein